MSIKTKTTAVAALAALTLPAGALAHGGDRADQAHKTNTERKAQKSKPKGKAFVIQGVKVTNLIVTDGKLDGTDTGAVSLDPTSANHHARKALGISKTELKGEDKFSFGHKGDAVVIKYVGLQSTDALAATDRVKFIGKIARNGGAIDIRKITVIRETETQS